MSLGIGFRVSIFCAASIQSTLPSRWSSQGKASCNRGESWRHWGDSTNKQCLIGFAPVNKWMLGLPEMICLLRFPRVSDCFRKFPTVPTVSNGFWRFLKNTLSYLVSWYLNMSYATLPSLTIMYSILPYPTLSYLASSYCTLPDLDLPYFALSYHLLPTLH